MPSADSYDRDLVCSRAGIGPAGEALKSTRGFHLPVIRPLRETGLVGDG